ncbi:MAG TPA: beta-ketoacyl-[acyl-carrier-protein] synthase II [Candidatus Omnitrophica bacterium]|nr:beta-ketoacyl-[acyl-carrier-protein] synthase II [Candidatus Omnitrophota bacterium]
MKRRVVITGLGVIAPNGNGKRAFWDALKEGRSGIRHITRFDPTPFPTQFAGESDFDPARFISPKQIKRMDRTSHLAVSAAKMAVEDAELIIKDENRERIGVMIGTAMAGHGLILEQHEAYMRKGPMRIDAFTAIGSFPDAPSSQISIELGINGPSFSLATACSSASDAIGYAFNAIRNQNLDVIIMGGADTPLFAPILSAFCVLRALSKRNDAPKKASRPFDRTRDGFVLGEGAGILILEDLEHALKRKAHIYGEILGFGMTCDAYHMTKPEPSGKQAIRALRQAIKDADIGPGDIDYINAHGTSTLLNDKNETSIIKEVFGASAAKVAVSSIKSMIGHLIGAAGSVELIGALMALEEGVIPPTINYENPDPECDLDYVPNKARKAEVNILLKNSFGFGGKNSALIVRKFKH